MEGQIEEKRAVNKELRFENIQSWIYQLLEGIDFLHSNNLIHRDLKPDNIGFSSNGTLKIFDFGLASAVLSRLNSSDVYQLTGATGTTRYMVI